MDMCIFVYVIRNSHHHYLRNTPPGATLSFPHLSQNLSIGSGWILLCIPSPHEGQTVSNSTSTFARFSVFLSSPSCFLFFTLDLDLDLVLDGADVLFVSFIAFSLVGSLVRRFDADLDRDTDTDADAEVDAEGDRDADDACEVLESFGSSVVLGSVSVFLRREIEEDTLVDRLGLSLGFDVVGGDEGDRMG
eukprot:1338199-Amorphochlora_amoeboformis.AAC.2